MHYPCDPFHNNRRLESFKCLKSFQGNSSSGWKAFSGLSESASGKLRLNFLKALKQTAFIINRQICPKRFSKLSTCFRTNVYSRSTWSFRLASGLPSTAISWLLSHFSQIKRGSAIKPICLHKVMSFEFLSTRDQLGTFTMRK